jgi:hypothetical protein
MGLVSVVLWFFEIPTVKAYQYFRPCVGSTVAIKNFEKGLRVEQK